MFDLLFGGITGLVGTIWSGYNQRKQKELDLRKEESKQKYMLAMVRVESEAMLAEAQANLHITESKLQDAIELTEAHMLSESQRSSKQQTLPTAFAEKLAATEGWAKIISIPLLSILCFTLALADVIKGLARPCITVYLLGVSTWISYKAWQLLDVADITLSAEQAVIILEQAISVLLYLSTTAVTWWFGDRMAEKNGKSPVKK